MNMYTDSHFGQFAYDAETHERIQRNQVVTSFRGDEWIFKGVDRPAYGNSSGRVAVSRTCPDAYTTSGGAQECPHMWHRNGIDREEFFPSVFGLYLAEPGEIEPVEPGTHATVVNRGSW